MKILLLAAAFCAVSFPAAAQKTRRDSTYNKDILKYKDEVGFYQKAYRDPGDPHFMLSDKSGNLDLGIGGTAKVLAGFGFGGAAKTLGFSPSEIVIPTDPTPSFGTDITPTELHFKARSMVRGHKLSAFIKIGGTSGNAIKIKQAYLSFDGFSVGLIPSFFNDLETGVLTTGNGLDTQVDATHTLFGYTHRFSDGWSVAGAVESPSLNLNFFDPTMGIETINQPLPDLTAHVKYRWDNGHVQLGLVARDLSYRVFDKTRSTFGYGMALSGTYRYSDDFHISYEFAGGRGIAAYLANFSDAHVDVGICDELKDGYTQLAAVPLATGQIAAQYNWTKSVSSSVVFGATRAFRMKGVQNFNNFKSSLSAIGNIFWQFNDYGYMGFEYLWGGKTVYATSGDPKIGSAHRIVYVIAYCF